MAVQSCLGSSFFFSFYVFLIAVFFLIKIIEVEDKIKMK